MEALSKQEALIVKKLAEAWDEFLKLPVAHISDNIEFMHFIHGAQNIILARPIVRDLQENHEVRDETTPACL